MVRFVTIHSRNRQRRVLRSSRFVTEIPFTPKTCFKQPFSQLSATEWSFGLLRFPTMVRPRCRVCCLLELVSRHPLISRVVFFRLLFDDSNMMVPCRNRSGESNQRVERVRGVSRTGEPGVLEGNFRLLLSQRDCRVFIFETLYLCCFCVCPCAFVTCDV